MDTTKHLLTTCACVVAIALTGCASTPGTTVTLLPLQDLNDYKVDCNNKDQQIEFLRRQIASPQFRRNNQIVMNTTGGILYSLADGSYQERKNQAEGWNQAVARRKIHYLETWCLKK